MCHYAKIAFKIAWTVRNLLVLKLPKSANTLHLYVSPRKGEKFWPLTPANHTSSFSSLFTQQVLPALYMLICGIGLVLNILAAWIFLRVPSDSGLVVYLKNMVVADLLMLSTYPWRVASEMDIGGWRLRVVVCRYTAVLFYSSMYVGIVFMGLISLERYVKIVRSSSTSTSCSSLLLQSVWFARGLALLTWGLLVLSMLPNVVLTSRPGHKESSRDCMKLKSPLGVQWHQASSLFSVGLFWVTLLVLGFCYSSIACRIYRSYRRVRQDAGEVYRKSNRSILSLLAVFFVCFVPYHACRVPYTLSQMPGASFSWHSRFLLFQIKEGTLFLSALNVCLDPIIYFLMCPTFKESLLKKLAGGVARRRKRSLTTVQSLSNI